MEIPSDLILQGRLSKWSVYLVKIVAIIAISVLIGWQFDLDALKRFSAPIAAMNPTTAICFLLISTSCYFLFKKIRNAKPLVIAFSGLVLVVAVLRLISICFRVDIAIDGMVYADKLRPDDISALPNRIAPNTAVCLLLTSIAIYLFASAKGYERILQWISLIVGSISLFSLLGYLFQVKSFYGVLIYLQMSLHTALSFFLISVSFLFASSDSALMKNITSKMSGSVTARRLLPAAIIIPSVLGFLRLWGYWKGTYENEIGMVLYALTTILLFVIFIWFNTSALNRRDLQSQQTKEALRQSEEQNRAIFDNGPDAIVVIDENGKIVKWNNQSRELFGWSQEEVIGQSLSDTIVSVQFNNAHEDELRNHFSGAPGNFVSKSIDLGAVRKNKTEVDVSLRISPLVLNGRNYFIGFIRDITERKELEQRLQIFNDELAKQVQEKTEELTGIFNRITDGFINLDKDFNYTYVNKQVVKMIRKDSSDLIGKNIWEIFPQSVGSNTHKAFLQAMETQQFVSNIDYYAPLDLWQENHIYPSANGISVFIRDISDRKKSELAIVEARDLADKLIDSLPGVFYFYNESGKIIRWNKQFELVTGYSADEIAHMKPVDFFALEDQVYVNKRIEKAFQRGFSDAEAHFLTKTGERTLYYFKAERINFEGSYSIIGTGIDLTELKRKTEQLEASEKKYKLLFESNPLPMWMLSLPDYNTIEVNDATLHQYGYSKEEFLNLDIFLLRPDEDIEKLKKSTNREFRGIYYAGIWRHRKKDGTVIYVDIVTHDFYHDGKPTRLVLANDLTKRYLAEEKLKESYEATRKLTEYLQNVREEERLHMAREVHDELGQLLTILKMDVSWLNKRLLKIGPEEKEKLTETLGLIDNIVKKVRHIASELRPSLLDDLGLVAAMEWHIEEFEKRTGIKKTMELPANELSLPDGLKIGLFRILQESLTNVARHAEANEVNVNLKQDKLQLILTIQDNGKGIDESKREKGKLGLLGMQERTKMMGGEYTIRGSSTGGTTVTVTVPLPLE